MAIHHVMGPAFPQLAILHRISNIVSSELSLDNMFVEMIGMAVQLTDCDACLIYLIDRETKDVVLRASKLPHGRSFATLRTKLDQRVTGSIIEDKSIVALSHRAFADLRFIQFGALAEDSYEAFLSIPLIASGEVLGAIHLHHLAPHQHSQEEMSVLAFAGEQIGGAIAKSMLAEENARLLEEASEMRRQLENRKLVERAKGILQSRQRLTEEEAYLRLRNESRRLRRPMRELAQAIILAEDLSRKSDHRPVS